MSYGWTGEKTRLVPLDKSAHLDNVVRWFNDPEVTQWMLTGDFPLTKIAEETWFDKRSEFPSQPTDLVLAIETLDGEHIGMTGLHAINHRDGTATTGTTIGDPGNWNKGFAADAIKTRSRYAFDVLNLRMLLSEVLEPNTASHKALQRAGYVEYGRLPRHRWKRGDYRDSILYVLTRETWRGQA
ncbi:MAG: GNAT family N-acetyltransferase [Phycisphaerae bacterium]